MNKIKLVIQNGHRNAPNGQTGTGGELALIDKVFYEIKKIIDAKYSGIIALYYDDATQINSPNMDYFIATHFDGATNQAYDGGFVDCNPDSATVAKDWEFARILADNYFTKMGIRFAPEHRTANSTYYYGFNNTGKNTIQTIIELGTLTNPSDNAKCQDVSKIARLLVEGFVNYLAQYDANYKAYIAGQTPVPPVSEVESLRKQLEEQKKLFAKLQQETTKQIADLKVECQSYKSRLDDVKMYVSKI